MLLALFAQMERTYSLERAAGAIYRRRFSAIELRRSQKLDEMIAFVRTGDTVIVYSMDRLARNLDDLRRLVRTLTGKGVWVEFVKESLTFTGED